MQRVFSHPSTQNGYLVCLFWLGFTAAMIPGRLPAALNEIARETGRIQAPAPLNQDGFGLAVAANASHLIVGAPGFASNEKFGAVHVFERQPDANPTLVRSIAGPADSTDRRFGISLAMGGDFFPQAA